MLIQHRHTEDRGLFFVEQDGQILAEMVYSSPSPNRMIIEHTEVSEELKGQKVGYELVSTAVDYARKHGIRITPLCPFAHAVFKRRTDYHDVLHFQ